MGEYSVTESRHGGITGRYYREKNGECLASELSWVEYMNSSNRLIRMRGIQKRVLGDASRYGRSNRTQTLKQQDQKSSREVVKDLTSNNNSTLQELITENKEESRRLKQKAEL